MLYAVLCYNDENAVWAWSKDHEQEVMAKLGHVQDAMARKGKLGPSARLRRGARHPAALPQHRLD